MENISVGKCTLWECDSEECFAWCRSQKTYWRSLFVTLTKTKVADHLDMRYSCCLMIKWTKCIQCCGILGTQPVCLGQLYQIWLRGQYWPMKVIEILRPVIDHLLFHKLLLRYSVPKHISKVCHNSSQVVCRWVQEKKNVENLGSLSFTNDIENRESDMEAEKRGTRTQF